MSQHERDPDEAERELLLRCPLRRFGGRSRNDRRNRDPDHQALQRGGPETTTAIRAASSIYAHARV
jgi:hypothetical protein